MGVLDFPSKKDYKVYHAKVVQYISQEYSDFNFKSMPNGSLLIQLSEIDKHEFHLLIGTGSHPKDSINNVAGFVVEAIHKSLFGESKFNSSPH